MSSDNSTSNGDAADQQAQDLISEWQYAKNRLSKLRDNLELRRELILVVSMLAAVFFFPAITWYRRWTYSPALQSYAILILPGVVAWIWIARRRLAVPEIDFIRKALRLEKQTRMKPKEIGEREKTVLDVLVHGPPVRDIRSSTLLYCALAVDAFGFWLRDPTLTCLGFILTCGGIVLFRNGRYAFKAALFPFLLMFTMIPIPGPIHDVIMDRAEPAILGMVEHIVDNVKQVAVLPIEGDPLNVGETVAKRPYPIYSERTGLGISESVLIVLCAIFYLSLIRTSNPLPKIGVLALTMAACFVMMLARLILICFAAVFDKDIASSIELLTRFLLTGVDLGLLFLFVRGFRCVKYYRWVSLSLKC